MEVLPRQFDAFDLSVSAFDRVSHNTESADRREYLAFAAVEVIDAVAVPGTLSLMSAREVEVAREHVVPSLSPIPLARAAVAMDVAVRGVVSSFD